MSRTISHRRSIVFLIAAFLLIYAPLPFSGIQEVGAHPMGCNLALNPTFEHGTATSVDNWVLANTSGAGSLSVVSNVVQSGSRAAQVVVTQPGDLYFVTIPEKTGISVSPNTTYVFSARLRSSNGAQAGLRVIEWTSGGAVAADRFLTLGGGTGDWISLEGTFTTTANTRYVALRLNHHISAGTFTWDDPRLWARVSGQRCVDTRHFVTQTTPGFRMCMVPNPPPYPAPPDKVCIDGYKDSYKEFLYGYTHGDRDYIMHNGTSADKIGVHKNQDSIEGWRCFADPGQLCGAPASGANASYPPLTLNTVMSLPVLTTTPPGNARTAGAFLVHTWQKFEKRHLNPNNGAQSAPYGAAWHRQFAFVAATVSFGGSLGTQQNVLVIEEEALDAVVYPNPPTNFGGGQRMERYYYVSGYGRVHQEGMENQNCINAPSASTCSGVYNNNHGIAALIYKVSGDYLINSVVPYNQVDWW